MSVSWSETPLQESAGIMSSSDSYPGKQKLEHTGIYGLLPRTLNIIDAST